MYTSSTSGMLNTDRFSGLATATLVLHVSDDAMVNFTQCEIDFLGNETALELYSYIGLYLTTFQANTTSHAMAAISSVAPGPNTTHGERPRMQF